MRPKKDAYAVNSHADGLRKLPAKTQLITAALEMSATAIKVPTYRA